MLTTVYNNSIVIIWQFCGILEKGDLSSLTEMYLKNRSQNLTEIYIKNRSQDLTEIYLKNRSQDLTEIYL